MASSGSSLLKLLGLLHCSTNISRRVIFPLSIHSSPLNSLAAHQLQRELMKYLKELLSRHHQAIQTLKIVAEGRGWHGNVCDETPASMISQDEPGNSRLVPDELIFG